MTDESDIRIVRLEPTRVASYRAIGKQPEYDAINTIKDWADQMGLSGGKDLRLFGFDNPGPGKGRNEYGYEVWLTVGPDVKSSGDIIIKEFDGGLYAVKQTNLPQIGQAWREIVQWRQASKYNQSERQCLEELLTPIEKISTDPILIDLYLPIEEK